MKSVNKRQAMPQAQPQTDGERSRPSVIALRDYVANLDAEVLTPLRALAQTLIFYRTGEFEQDELIKGIGWTLDALVRKAEHLEAFYLGEGGDEDE